MENRKKIGFVLAVLMFVGIGVGFYYFSQQRISEDAEDTIEKFKIIVTPFSGSSKTYLLSLESSNVKVLHYHEGGTMLEVTERGEIKWQLNIGCEDELYDGEGDFSDTIIKMARMDDDSLYIEIGCLGSYRKQVFFNGVQKLDTDSLRFTYFTTT